MNLKISDFVQSIRLRSMQAFFDVGIKRFSRITLNELRNTMDLIESPNSKLITASAFHFKKSICLKWGKKREHAVVHFHSGGYVTGGHLTSAQFCQALYSETGKYVICPSYPLSPELTIPEIVNWSLELLNFLIDEGVKSFSLTGVSAGANLVTLMCLANNYNINITEIHLITGHFQSDFDTPSANKYESGELSGLSKSMLLKLLDYAISDREVHMEDPAIFPLYSNELSKLPKSFIYAAKYDVLYDDSLKFYEKLIHEGVNVRFKEFSDGFHAWSNYVLENKSLLNYAKEHIFNEIK